MSTVRRDGNLLGVACKGAVCALAWLLMGCPSGDKVGESELSRERKLYAPERILDTTFTVNDLLYQDACDAELCTKRKNEVDRICAEVVPLSGWIWTRGSDGGSCRCACTSLLRMTTWQLDSTRRSKQLFEAEKIASNLDAKGALEQGKSERSGKQAEKSREKKSMSAARDLQEVLRADCASTEQGRALVRITCLRPVWTSKPAMAEWAFMLYLQEENFPIFLASIGDSSGDYPGNNGYWGGLDDWDIGDGRRDEGFVIGFPRDFVEAPEVGWELMLFFIGHELGHALGDEAPCHDEVGIVCEGQCDHWAASVALRRVVGDGLFCKSYSTIAQSAADQLEEYMTRIHSDPSCGGPYCDVMCADNSPACGHPPMECRTATIEAAIDLLAEPTCTRSWYTDPDRSISCPAPTFPGGDPCPP